MNIGIIGAGRVGTALGKRWAAGGHEIVFGVRKPGDARISALVAELGPKARAASNREAASFAEVGRDPPGGRPERQGADRLHEPARARPQRVDDRSQRLGG